MPQIVDAEMGAESGGGMVCVCVCVSVCLIVCIYLFVHVRSCASSIFVACT